MKRKRHGNYDGIDFLIFRFVLLGVAVWEVIPDTCKISLEPEKRKENCNLPSKKTDAISGKLGKCFAYVKG